MTMSYTLTATKWSSNTPAMARHKQLLYAWRAYNDGIPY